MVRTHMHFLNIHIYVLLLCRKESSSIDISVDVLTHHREQLQKQFSYTIASLSIKLYRLREDSFTEVT